MQWTQCEIKSNVNAKKPDDIYYTDGIIFDRIAKSTSKSNLYKKTQKSVNFFPKSISPFSTSRYNHWRRLFNSHLKWLLQWMSLSAMDFCCMLYIDQIDHKWCIVSFSSEITLNHIRTCAIFHFINGNNNKQHVSFLRSHVRNKNVQQTMV